MPITQERLISLIDCTDALGGRIKELVEHVKLQERLLVENGKDNHILLYNLLTDMHNRIQNAAQFPESVVATISVEKTHFSKSRHKNELGKRAVRHWRDRKKNFAITEIPDYSDDDQPLALPAKRVEMTRIDEDLIAAIDELFEENPNNNSMLSQAQLEELISEVLSVSNPDHITNITYKLVDNKIIQAAYRPGPSGIWIRGTQLNGMQTSVHYKPGMWLPPED